MQDYGSFVHYHYARQMGMYLWMLFHLCKKSLVWTSHGIFPLTLLL